MKDLDFLESYWSKAKKIGLKIVKELPMCSIKDSKTLIEVNPQSTVKMYLIKYSDLGDNWNPKDILQKLGGQSKTLSILADKINYMILKGRANDVKPMIEKICSGRTKHFGKMQKTKKSTILSDEYYRKGDNSEFYIGKGHFRWNHFGAYTLTPQEIERLKEYFKIVDN